MNTYNFDPELRKIFMEYVDKDIYDWTEYYKTCAKVVKLCGPALEHVKYPSVTTIDCDEELVQYLDKILANVYHRSNMFNKYLTIMTGCTISTQYAKICALAIIENPDSLKYVRVSIGINIYYRLCMISTSIYGLALRYVTELLVQNDLMLSDTNYYNICTSAVKQDGTSLKYVDKNLFRWSPTTYYNICICAVQQNCWALQYVDSDILCKTPNNDVLYRSDILDIYMNICIDAVIKHPNALIHINKKFEYILSNLTNSYHMDIYTAYTNICKIAIANHHTNLQQSALNYIRPYKYLVANHVQIDNSIYDNIYIDLCIASVNKNGLTLKYVNDVHVKQSYENICTDAVINNGLALQFVNFTNNYDIICKYAITNNPQSLFHVDKSKLINKTIYNDIHVYALSLDMTLLKHTKQTVELCEQVVNNNGAAILYIDRSIFNSDQYINILCLSIYKSKSFIHREYKIQDNSINRLNFINSKMIISNDIMDILISIRTNHVKRAN